MFWLCVFWSSVLLMFHSYLLFPWLLQVMAKGKKQNQHIYNSIDDDLPFVSILLAAYNEDKVIGQKITSTFNTNYPKEKIEFLIGSDASTDATNIIVEKLAAEFPQIKLVHFQGRTGKAGIINQLSRMATHPVFILTDANVFFHQDTIYNLVKHYKNPEIALVGGNIINTDIKHDGISHQEKTYLSRENKLKYQEGVLWGCMIGAFGGCYSVRATHYAEVPPRFFMDDFYITMHCLRKGGKAINELDATCSEDVSNKITEEFRRKIRISIGNFQNLSRFYGLLSNVFSGLAFCFFSHKVIRWFGPLLIASTLISSYKLSYSGEFYKLCFWGQLILLLLPVLDELLKKINIHNSLLRFVSHFYLMNLALLVGLFKFLKGVKTNVWKPTERYQ
ncbi:MAG: glycosyltransferase [Bacteroidetes bacterium]|nr:glycosyltransferase [Bacteroidota bacterium]